MFSLERTSSSEDFYSGRDSFRELPPELALNAAGGSSPSGFEKETYRSVPDLAAVAYHGDSEEMSPKAYGMPSPFDLGFPFEAVKKEMTPMVPYTFLEMASNAQPRTASVEDAFADDFSDLLTDPSSGSTTLPDFETIAISIDFTFESLTKADAIAAESMETKSEETSQLTVKVPNVPRETYSLEKITSFEVDSHPDVMHVVRGIKSTLESNSDLTTTFQSAPARWLCSMSHTPVGEAQTKRKIDFRISLFKKSVNKKLVVEVQKRAGCQFTFVQTYRKLRSAIEATCA